MTLDKNAVLARAKRRFGTFEYDGETARFRSLFASEVRDFYQSLQDSKGDVVPEKNKRFRELCLAQVLVDDNGDRLLTDAEIMEGMLDSIDFRFLVAVSDAAMKFAGLDTDRDFQAIEEAVKNSDATRESSSSDVPAPDLVVTT